MRLLVLLWLLAWSASAETVTIAADGTVYRCTRRVTFEEARTGRYPAARLQARGGRLVDGAPPDGVTLYYVSRGNTVSVTTPPRALPRLASPRLLIDKRNYVLEVQDAGRVVKRYPVALGANPVNRKLCQDRASTPEGRYRIINLQPEATFFKAYDIDYPTALDWDRYDFAAAHGLLPAGNPPIGGEIQIHGKGIETNWTWGCIALRNEDMVELFAHPEIASGVEVLITGAQLSLQDLQAIARAPRAELARRGLGSPAALGEYQVKKGLPVTCEPDARTLKSLGL